MNSPGSQPSITANPDIVTVLMSYSDNRTIQLLMQSGADYSTRALQSSTFWHSRVETLFGRRVPYSAQADWKETYYIVERELKKKRLSPLYNEEDNALASRLLIDQYFEGEVSYHNLASDLLSIISEGKVNILQFVLSDPRFDATIKRRSGGLVNTATRNGQLEAVKLLRSDPRLYTSGYELLSAAGASETDVPIENYIELVRIFLADPDIDPRMDGDIVLTDYVSYSSRDNPEIMQLLLDDGRADPMADNGKPLAAAARNGRAQALAVLLADPRVNPVIADNGNLLLHSVEAGHPTVVRLLLRDGRIDPSRNDGEALITAIQSNNTEIALTLLADGRIDPAVADNWALTEAIKYDNGRVIDQLLTRSDVLESLSDEDLELAEQVGNPDMVATIRDALDRRE